MSDTLLPNGTKRPVFESSMFATRAFNTLRYSLMNIFILFGIVFIAMGGPWSYMGLIFSFVLVGYVDELFGDISDRERMPPVWYWFRRCGIFTSCVSFSNEVSPSPPKNPSAWLRT